MSDDTIYRYTLTRSGWIGENGRLCWVMLNPSTADDNVDDPTIRRVIRFTKDAGYSSLEVVNLFAARSTNPKQLLHMRDPRGPHNAMAVATAIHRADAIVLAWGAWFQAQSNRPARLNVEDVARNAGLVPLCLGWTAAGAPRHPLYVPADQPFVSYPYEVAA